MVWYGMVWYRICYGMAGYHTTRPIKIHETFYDPMESCARNVTHENLSEDQTKIVDCKTLLSAFMGQQGQSSGRDHLEPDCL
jgi:hypothetical protein